MMHQIMLVSAIFSWVLALMALVNLRTMVRPLKTDPPEVLESVEILIPARNEQSTIASCVTCALAQTRIFDLKVTVLDDGSSDDTLAELNKIVDKRLKVLPGDEELPKGWLGKPWACARLAAQSKAEYLVFIDADVDLNVDAVAHGIEMMHRANLSLISPYPKQLAQTILTRLIQPLLQWSWLSTVVLSIARTTKRSSLAVANGQFLICRRSDYELVGGHSSAADQVLDDIMLLRSFYKAGLTGTVADGTRLATCHMYETDRELVDGYSKSLWRAFNGIVGSVFTNALLFIVYALPLYGLLTQDWPLALIAIIGASYGRWIVAVRTGQHRIPDVFTHGLAIAVFVGLNIFSWLKHLLGRNTWKGRSV